MNHLKFEKSPYLLQHAENPVDWYPWCEEAFALAAKRDVPVFLSIGYSTCHWCHVMAHESFEDEEVAALLNEEFVAIKVDREERPDIDSVYMSVCQAMTGSGGWPLTIVMTPQQHPFFAGTYYPKNSRQGHPGLLRLLRAISKKWKEDKSSLLVQSDQVVSFIKSLEDRTEANIRTGADGQPVSEEEIIDTQALIDEAAGYFTRNFDRKNGGFGASPKFPSAHNLLFLMAQRGKKGDKYLSMAEKTLQQMYRGGIFDHIGGGFCRYSTDDCWLVPHFEKMLYDNALLLLAYSQGYVETGNNLYRSIADKIAVYVRRELTSPEGGFYCSQDADSDGTEGKYYVFTPEEIRMLLPLEPAAAFCSQYDITPSGNFEGKSIPNLLKTEDFSSLPDEDLLRILYEYRLERTVLHRDDKILTGWNGLMIAAFARAARQLKKADYLEAALKGADFIWKNLCVEENTPEKSVFLYTRFREGNRACTGILDDYAFFAWSLLECYSTTFNPLYLQRADSIGRKMLEQFFDEEKGGCYLYGKDSEQLFVRPKETYDGAIPSGNAAAALVMKKLAFFTGESLWEKAAEKQWNFMNKQCQGQAAGHGFYLWALSEVLEDRGQLICTAAAAESGENLPPETLCTLWNLDVDILLKTPETAEILCSVSPYMENYPLPESGMQFYFCKDQICRNPVSSLEELESLM